MEAGAFPLTGVGALPHVSVAFPGEVWSDHKASGDILPGTPVMPAQDASGRAVCRAAGSGEVSDPRCGIAFRVVETPDTNNGPNAEGPNEIVNRVISAGEYLRRYTSGVFHLTLVEPDDTWEHGDLVGWDPGAARPAGKPAGTGAWVKVADAADAFGYVKQPFRPYNDDGDEGVLTVASLRGQF